MEVCLRLDYIKKSLEKNSINEINFFKLIKNQINQSIFNLFKYSLNG